MLQTNGYRCSLKSPPQENTMRTTGKKENPKSTTLMTSLLSLHPSLVSHERRSTDTVKSMAQPWTGRAVYKKTFFRRISTDWEGSVISAGASLLIRLLHTISSKGSLNRGIDPERQVPRNIVAQRRPRPQLLSVHRKRRVVGLIAHCISPKDGCQRQREQPLGAEIPVP